MKTSYVDYSSRSIADLVKPGELTKGWTITRINVPSQNRGHGFGTRLLKQICSDADKENVSLWLEPYPSGDLDYQALVDWYSRHGFVMTSLGYMKRKPNGKAS